MNFMPNPQLSMEQNLVDFEKQFRKEKWYKEMAQGILFPLYPVFWVLDFRANKKLKKAIKKRIEQQLRDPMYLIKWELLEAERYNGEIQEKLAELEEIQSQFKTSASKLAPESLGDTSRQLIAQKQEEIQDQINLQTTKVKFFQTYLNNLRAVQLIHQTEKKLSTVQSQEGEIFEMLLYKQKLEDLQADGYEKMRTLSSVMAQCQEKERAEILMQLLEER